ncbi:site-specific integrase [Burkholderia sp. R-69927]|uniref:site-specific integrase n=1 Tax=Paraburkholderia domus TaxID=2793075 RepID=UPI001914CC9F|nr:site-specific integrase [Paraburkholderia domus]MBK5084617.1 site-specific integrase [Burkholderia sp. R-69927]
MKISQGLMRRDNGMYYARRRVPKHLVKALNRTEIRVALGTNVRSVANARLPAALKKINNQLAVERPGVEQAVVAPRRPIPVSLLRHIAREWFAPKWEAMERELALPLPPHISRKTAVDWLEAELFPTKDGEEIRELKYAGEAEGLLKRAGHGDADHASVGILANYLKRGDIDLLELHLRHLDGDAGHQLHDPLYLSFNDPEQVVSSPRNVLAKRPEGQTLEQAIDRFLSDRQRANLSAKNSQGYETGFNLLREIVGRAALLTSVNRDHARRMQEVLAHLPPNATKRFPHMSLLQAAEHAHTARLPAIQRKTAANTLSNMSAFFRWATDEHLVSRSVFNGLEPLQEQRAKDRQRQPFTAGELEKLFSSKMYRYPFDAVTCVHPGRYWVPLLALYHGARLNELCQLETADIDCQDHQWCIRFTKESAAGEVKYLKNASAERTVPLHPVLQQVGFLDYVEFVRKQGGTRLFPDLTKAKTGYYSDNFSKWFARYRKEQRVDRPVTNFHCFRHGFNDACRAANVPQEIVEQICGWTADDSAAKQSMARAYGRGHPLRRKAEEIAKVRFSSVEKVLPALQGVNSGLEGRE